ncbi:H-type lectin domain-containing protein [Neomegalonema sp.]|uniref:H-type lectin domain-containing protein n=1 Tax=Neomegalonema sp. TaxID=2039713 RepID=UPI002605C36E|nr:H-type lectin domain-containing protein [Neomegalonema sp.]MDD2868008.1 H-type lectin domain-containing protein [Neomegalonema sp.]
MLRTGRNLLKILRIGALSGLAFPGASALEGGAARAQDAGAGLIERLRVLEQEVASLKERRFESGNLTLSREDIPELTKTTECAEANGWGTRGLVNQKVTFSKPFPRPPRVIVSLRRVDNGSGDDIIRLHLEANNITPEGFEYSFYTWCKSSVWVAHGTWFAFLEG